MLGRLDKKAVPSPGTIARKAGAGAPVRAKRPAFSLVELLVVISVISLLVMILMPTFARTRELARRAVCLTNLRGIAVNVLAYAAANNGLVIPIRNEYEYGESNNFVTTCFNPKWEKAASEAGFAGPGGACPNRPNFPYRTPSGMGDGNFIVLGYVYYGGVTVWRNPYLPDWNRGVPSRSPVFVHKSEPDWCLATDAMFKMDGIWGGGPAGFAQAPQHRWRDPWPEGGNEVFVDGSARWIPFEQTWFVHAWWDNFGRILYMYQADLGDYHPPPEARGQP